MFFGPLIGLSQPTILLYISNVKNARFLPSLLKTTTTTTTTTTRLESFRKYIKK